MGVIKDNIGIKNILILVLVILVIIGFIKGPNWYKQVVGSHYEGIAEATITNIVAKQASAQHLNGSNTKTIGYELSYLYKVGNEEFANTEFIEPGQDIKLVFDRFISGEACLIEIKYSQETPSKSIVSKLLVN
jgi:hypothetical protein